MLLLTVVVAAVFGQVLDHDFINYDDPLFVVQNGNINAGISSASVKWSFVTFYESNWIPLTWLSHLLDVQLFGLNPIGHHLTNLLLHIATTLLLCNFLFCTTGYLWRSIAVALLFALHPLHVESVAWVAERKDVLSAFFWMATLSGYRYYVEKPNIGRYVLVVVLFILGLLAKQMLISLPVILLLLDFWPLLRLSALQEKSCRCWPFTTQQFVRLVTEKIPLFIVSGIAAIIAYLAQKSGGSLQENLDLSTRSVNALFAYSHYLAKTFWPTKLAVLYPYILWKPSLLIVFLTVGILVMVTGVVWHCRKGKPFLLTGWLWYLASLAPVSGFVHIGFHSVADRYTYLPIIGIFIMVVWLLPELLKGYFYKNFLLAILSGVVFIAISVLSWRQLGYWKNSIALFSRTIAVTDNNWIAHNNLGVGFGEQGRVDEAIAQFNEAVRINPKFFNAYFNLGFAHYNNGDFQRARIAFENAIELQPGHSISYKQLGLTYLKLGRGDLALAVYAVMERNKLPNAPELLIELLASKVIRGE